MNNIVFFYLRQAMQFAAVSDVLLWPEAVPAAERGPSEELAVSAQAVPDATAAPIPNPMPNPTASAPIRPIYAAADFGELITALLLGDSGKGDPAGGLQHCTHSSLRISTARAQCGKAATNL